MALVFFLFLRPHQDIRVALEDMLLRTDDDYDYDGQSQRED